MRKVHLKIDGGLLTSESDGTTRRLFRATLEAVGQRSGRRYVASGEGKAPHVAIGRAADSLGQQMREVGDHR